MTLEDVKVQVEALMRELEEGKNISMMCVLNEGKESALAAVGGPVNLSVAIATGVAKYLAVSGDMSLVESFCDYVTEEAKVLMENRGVIN